MNYKFKFRKYAEALYDALRDDAFYKNMEESVVDGSPREAMLKYMDYSMREGERFGELYVPETQEFGVSVWAKPLQQRAAAEKNMRKKDFIKVYMGGNSLETYTAITSSMSAKTTPLVQGEAWYLSIIGVLPAFQGRGLGAGLVENILARTDQAGIPTYLETFTPRTISFYNRLGYRVVDCFKEPRTEANYWVMVRDAQPN